MHTRSRVPFRAPYMISAFLVAILLSCTASDIESDLTEVKNMNGEKSRKARSKRIVESDRGRVADMNYDDIPELDADRNMSR